MPLKKLVETVLTTKTLSEIAKEVGVNVKTLSWRINRMKNRSDFLEKFDRAYRKYLQKISHSMVYGDHRYPTVRIFFDCEVEQGKRKDGTLSSSRLV